MMMQERGGAECIGNRFPLRLKAHYLPFLAYCADSSGTRGYLWPEGIVFGFNRGE